MPVFCSGQPGELVGVEFSNSFNNFQPGVENVILSGVACTCTPPQTFAYPLARRAGLERMCGRKRTPGKFTPVEFVCQRLHCRCNGAPVRSWNGSDRAAPLGERRPFDQAGARIMLRWFRGSACWAKAGQTPARCRVPVASSYCQPSNTAMTDKLALQVSDSSSVLNRLRELRQASVPCRIGSE